VGGGGGGGGERERDCVCMYTCVYVCVCVCGLTRNIRMYVMANSYVGHDSFICVTWRVHMCGMNCPYA